MDKALLEIPVERCAPPGRVASALDGDATKANVRSVGIAMAIAFALMAVFNSAGLRSYARDLPGGWLADELVIRADQWHELMLALGPAHARPAVRAIFDDARDMSW